MPITDTLIRKTNPTEKPQHLFDGGGLFLLITPTGGKWWRFKYRFDGKSKTISMGVYPEITLKEARIKREKARSMLASGIDPGEQRKAEKQSASKIIADSFEVIAREWFLKFSANWAHSHAIKIIQRLERDVFPWLGSRPLREISPPELLTVLRRIEERGAIDTAHRTKQNCSQIFRYAIATGRGDRDPSIDLRGAIPPPKEGHFEAITDPADLGLLLRAIDAYPGFLVVRCALKLLPFTFVRPGELRKAEWREIDLDKEEWSIPGERMKTKQPHIVPLSRQAVTILKELHPLTGSGQFVFPGARNQGNPMSDMATSVALKSLGYSEVMTAHGFRATARTLLDEVLGFRPEVIEHQLAHAVRDPLGRAYNRTTHLAERKRMMQVWADYLDDLKNPKT